MAFLTGSRVYGSPTEDSDIDMVIMAEEEQLIALLVAQSETPGGLPIRFGKLNVIVAKDINTYAAWLSARNVCVNKMKTTGKKLTKADATLIHRKVFDSAGLDQGFLVGASGDHEARAEARARRQPYA